MADELDRKRFTALLGAWTVVCAIVFLVAREEPEDDSLHHDEARARAAALLSDSGYEIEDHILVTSARSDREGEGWVMLFNVPGAHDLDQAWVVRLDDEARRILSIERPEDGRDG